MIPGEATDADPSFALILERESPRPDAEIGRLLACHLPIHASDAISRVRYGGGLIVKGIPAAAADEIAGRLREIGVMTRRIEARRWGPVPRGRRVAWIGFGDTALEVRLRGKGAFLLPGGALQGGIFVPREDVLGIHLHGTTPPPPRAVEEGRWARLWKTREVEAAPSIDIEKAVLLREEAASVRGAAGEESAEDPAGRLPALSPRGLELLRNILGTGLSGMEFHVTLYCADPVGILRIEKNDFDFTSLDEQRQEHSLDNFLILIEELLAFLPAAWNRRPAERFVESLDPRRIHCLKEEEAQNFDRWMLEWVRIEMEHRREDRGGERRAERRSAG